MEESSWTRAGKDTENFRSKRTWFFGVETLGSGAIAGLTALMLWDRSASPGWLVGLITFGVFTGGLFLIYGLIYIWNLFRAPYRQRNEAWKAKPKLVFLPKMDELLRVIAEAKMATDQMADNIIDIKRLDVNTIFINPEMPVILNGIRIRFKYACESLEREILVASSDYEPILEKFIAYMRDATKLDSSTISDYKIKLKEMVMITRNKIEELSQQVPGNEDSQPE